MRDDRIVADDRLLPSWRQLLEQHPQRFVVAVDAFSAHRWQHYEAVTAQIRTWVAPLPQPLKTNLLHDNAARLFDAFRPLPRPR